MDLGIDANVFMAALISSTGKSNEFFFSNQFQLFALEYLKIEIEKYKPVIAKKAGLTITDLDLAITLLSSKIVFSTFEDFEKFIKHAKKICPDPNDVEYFSLALKLNCPFWSNDKELKKQHEVKIISTTELVKMWG